MVNKMLRIGGEHSREIKFILIQDNNISYAIGGFRNREEIAEHLKHKAMSQDDLFIYEVNPIKITVEKTFG